MDFFKFLPKLSLTAAQKERYETQIMLLKAEHKAAIEKLEAENRDLRAEVEKLKEENNQLHMTVSVLQNNVKWHEDMERSRLDDDQSLPGSVGL